MRAREVIECWKEGRPFDVDEESLPFIAARSDVEDVCRRALSLLRREGMCGLYAITGVRGSGKSQVARFLVHLARARGLSAGIVSLESVLRTHRIPADRIIIIDELDHAAPLELTSEELQAFGKELHERMRLQAVILTGTSKSVLSLCRKLNLPEPRVLIDTSMLSRERICQELGSALSRALEVLYPEQLKGLERVVRKFCEFVLEREVLVRKSSLRAGLMIAVAVLLSALDRLETRETSASEVLRAICSLLNIRVKLDELSMEVRCPSTEMKCGMTEVEVALNQERFSLLLMMTREVKQVKPQRTFLYVLIGRGEPSVKGGAVLMPLDERLYLFCRHVTPQAVPELLTRLAVAEELRRGALLAGVLEAIRRVREPRRVISLLALQVALRLSLSRPLLSREKIEAVIEEALRSSGMNELITHARELVEALLARLRILGAIVSETCCYLPSRLREDIASLSRAIESELRFRLELLGALESNLDQKVAGDSRC